MLRISRLLRMNMIFGWDNADKYDVKEEKSYVA